MRWFSLFLLGVLLPSSVSAGPWPREPGTGFFGFSVEFWESEIEDLPHYYGSILVEYGVTKRLTLGTKFAMGSDTASLLDLRMGIALVVDRPYTLSLELAAGQLVNQRYLLVPDVTLDDDVTAPFNRVGLAYGRGFSLGERSGWFAAELSRIGPVGDREPALGLGDVSWSLDTTFGLNLRNDWKLLGQVFALRTDTGEDIVKIAPGIAIPIGEGAHLEIGARILTDDLEGSALALGFWNAF